MFGWRGRLLRVNLTSGALTPERLEQSVAQRCLGGRGLGLYLHAKEAPATTAPGSAVNPLIFTTGPLTGTLVPNGGRYTVIAKIPPFGEMGVASLSGNWGPELKFAGFDGIIVEGQAPTPVYLWIDNGQAELRPAKHLWGRPVGEATETLLAETDAKAVVAGIGPAGENGLDCALVVSDYASAAGAGLGAVMGAKNLKAVAVRGTEGFRMASPQRFRKLVLDLRAQLVEHAIAAQGTVLHDSVLRVGSTAWVSNPAGAKPARPHGCFGCATSFASLAAQDTGTSIALSETTSLAESQERLTQYRALLNLGLDFARAKAILQERQPATESEAAELALRLAYGDLPGKPGGDPWSGGSTPVIDRGPCVAGGYAVAPELTSDEEDQDLLAVLDSAGICPFLAGRMSAETVAELLTAATGVAFSADDVLQVGQRINGTMGKKSAAGGIG